MHKKKFSEKIIEWYGEHNRALPWRETTDPYKIWLSEIILQQTRVAQGFPYYLKFIERFPDVGSLARAREQDVLRLWQGLGYYTRARNLYRCAKVIVKEFNGNFPGSFLALQELPGIGVYTAAAIASIAFHEQVPVVDGNVFRVLARVFGIEKNISSADGRRYFFDKAKELIPADRPAEFNQALMEFGALHCVPKNPKCYDCIFSRSCVALARQEQSRLPVKDKKNKSQKRYIYYWVIQQNKKIAMKKRVEKDIWQGLFDFYAEETPESKKTVGLITRSNVRGKFEYNSKIGKASPEYKHLLTHQTLLARFIPVEIISKKRALVNLSIRGLKFYSAKEITKLPKPVLVSRYLSDIGFL